MATSISNTTGSISSAGIGSGLNVDDIVTRLMTVEQRPLTILQTAASSLNTKLSSVGKLQGYFSALRDKSNALTTANLWGATVATSSDSNAVGVSTSANAAAGSYAIAVTKLAVGQTVTSTALPQSTSTLSAGTLTIELGRYGSGDPAADFTAKDGSSALTIEIGSGETSLADIRDKINAARGGVTAAIVSDASGARLTLRSTDTGADNAFRVSVAEAVDDGASATGLSMLAYDATAGSSAMNRSATAANAELTVNGIALSSASNTLTDVVDGLSLTLRKTTTTDVAVNVAPDTASVKTAVTDFVSAFNTLASFIKTQTAYNADTKTAGALQGDQSTLALQAQLRAVINAESSASSTWGKLSDIGIAMKSDGTLETNATKLDNALGKLPDLKDLLAADGASNGDSGFVRRFKRLADAALSTDGSLDSRLVGLRANVDRNSKSQEDMQTRLTRTEARMRAQYQALDTKMASLNSLSTYMTQQITKMNASSA